MALWKPLAKTPWEVSNGQITQSLSPQKRCGGQHSHRMWHAELTHQHACGITSTFTFLYLNLGLISSFSSCLFLKNCSLHFLLPTQAHTDRFGLSHAPHCPLVSALLLPPLNYIQVFENSVPTQFLMASTLHQLPCSLILSCLNFPTTFIMRTTSQKPMLDKKHPSYTLSK